MEKTKWVFAGVLASLVFLGSGCLGGNGGGQTKTYTIQKGDSSVVVEVNNNTESYELTMDMNMNLTQAKQGGIYQGSTDKEIVNGPLNLVCNLLQGLTYNFTTTSGTEEMPIVQEVPNYVWRDYEAEKVEVVLYEKATSEKLGSCNVKEDSIEKEILVG